MDLGVNSHHTQTIKGGHRSRSADSRRLWPCTGWEWEQREVGV